MVFTEKVLKTIHVSIRNSTTSSSRTAVLLFTSPTYTDWVAKATLYSSSCETPPGIGRSGQLFKIKLLTVTA